MQRQASVGPARCQHASQIGIAQIDLLITRDREVCIQFRVTRAYDLGEFSGCIYLDVAPARREIGTRDHEIIFRVERETVRYPMVDLDKSLEGLSSRIGNHFFPNKYTSLFHNSELKLSESILRARGHEPEATSPRPRAQGHESAAQLFALLRRARPARFTVRISSSLPLSCCWSRWRSA